MSEIMSRGDVVDTVAAQVDLPRKAVDEIIRAFESAVKRQVSTGGEIRMTGFGAFKITHRAERVSRNPRTGEPVDVPAHNALRFLPGKELKEAAAASLKTEAAPVKKTKAKVSEAKPVVSGDTKKEKKPVKKKK